MPEAASIEGSAKHDVKRSTQNLKKVLDKLEDGFVLVDRQGHLSLINRTACKIFDVKASQGLGKPVNLVIYHTDLLDLFKPGRIYPYRNEISVEDGRVFSAQASEIENVGVAVILHDVSHLKELDRIKTDFVNTVSHDLRSPLTAVYGFIGLIDRVGPINQQQAEFIRHIQASLHNITSLINDLLDLGRIEASQNLLMEDVDMKAILRDAIDNLEYQSSEKMQDVVLSSPDELPVILGNPLHLMEMATNLIENAIKFTPLTGRIEIRCRSEAGQLIIEVSDNGPGIPIRDQPHVFEKFYRGSNLVHTTNGTGLGLSIVKTIVDKHLGRIWLESSPAGTTFTVILPLK